MRRGVRAEIASRIGIAASACVGIVVPFAIALPIDLLRPRDPPRDGRR